MMKTVVVVKLFMKSAKYTKSAFEVHFSILFHLLFFDLTEHLQSDETSLSWRAVFLNFGEKASNLAVLGCCLATN